MAHGPCQPYMALYCQSRTSYCVPQYMHFGRSRRRARPSTTGSRTAWTVTWYMETIYEIDFINEAFCRSWKSPAMVCRGHGITVYHFDIVVFTSETNQLLQAKHYCGGFEPSLRLDCYPAATALHTIILQNLTPARVSSPCFSPIIQLLLGTYPAMGGHSKQTSC